MYRKALALNEELGRKDGMAKQYGNLGAVYQTRNALDQAEEMHKKALALYEEVGAKEGMAIGNGNLGIVYLERGDLNQAEAMSEKALALFQEVGAALRVEETKELLDHLRSLNAC